MRKVLWTLGALGTVGLALTASTAQDRYSGFSPYRTTNPQTRGYGYLGRDAETSGAEADSAAADEALPPTRYSRSRTQPTTAPKAGVSSHPQGLKNYQKELFGTDAPAQTPAGAGATAAPRKILREPTSAAPRPATVRAPIRDNQIRQTNGASAADTEPTGARQGGGFSQDIDPRGVMRADFSKEPNQAETVKQVSGTSKATRLPEIEEPVSEKPELKLLPDQPPPALGAAGSNTKKDPRATLGKPVAPIGSKTLAPKISQSAGGASGIPTNYSTESPRITVEWRKLSDVNVGQPCALELVVTNAGGAAASDVAIEAYFPASVRLTESKPEPTSASEHVTWRIAALPAGEERRIAITLIPSERGEIAANANIRYTTAATTTLTVEEPLLKLAMSGPDQVSVGEPATQLVTVSNPGTGIAHNVTLEVNLPEGLEHPRGNRLMMDLGSLTPNESRSVKLTLSAKAGGEQIVRVDAKAGVDLQQSTTAKINVLAPSLKLAMEGPGLRYVGRDARYTLNVTNDGVTTTNNVRAVYIVPKGFEFLQASNGGSYDESIRTVSWFLGSIDPAKSIELSLKLRPTEQGQFAHVAKVVSEHGATAEARTETRIDGTASLVLEVVDLDDPVEIGRETAYEVRVRNDGSKEANNVGLSVELPAGIELLSVKAPVDHLAESGLVVFKSLPQLPAGKTAIFQLIVKGRDEGNQRLRARLTSNSIQEPLTIEELTKFYAD